MNDQTIALSAQQIAAVRKIKRLLWLYFWLWIFEGSLRKWILPGLANPLLIVRDPVVIAIYWLAWNQRLFPRNNFLVLSGMLGVVCLTVGLIALNGLLPIALYGYRTDFLYLPLIFIIPQVFDAEDVRKIGRAVLIVAIPMAILMAIQFLAPPNSYINSGQDAAFGQIESAEGHIRPPGTFSYILGPSCFFPLAAAFLLDSVISTRRYPGWLLLSSAVAMGVAVAVSGSRGLLSSVVIVAVFAAVAGVVLRPESLWKVLIAVGLALLVFGLLNQLDIFREGASVFSERASSASNAEGGSEGFVGRFTNDLIGPFSTLNDIPLQGFGLGYGTNVAAGIISGEGQRVFLLSEGEWGRILLESGPILGILFLVVRLYLSGYVVRMGLKAASKGLLLPFSLAGSCFLGVLNGQWGVPTALGYSIFCCGICLASTRETN